MKSFAIPYSAKGVGLDRGTSCITTGVADCPPCYGTAVKLYETGRWLEAFHDFSALADGGHAPAARWALLMMRHGAGIYAERFDVGPQTVARWASCVLKSLHKP